MTVPDIDDKTRAREVLARVIQEIIRRQMTAPALFVLETGKPLSFLASQALLFLEPFVQPLLSIKDYEVFALAIEDRHNVEWMIEQLEAAEEGRTPGPGADGADEGQAT